jgi:hypothetical protein
VLSFKNAKQLNCRLWLVEIYVNHNLSPIEWAHRWRKIQRVASFLNTFMAAQLLRARYSQKNALNKAREYISLSPSKWLTGPKNPGAGATGRDRPGRILAGLNGYVILD